MIERTVRDFDAWRAAARELISRGLSPSDVHWRSADDAQQELPLDIDSEPRRETIGPTAFRVPKQFLDLAKHVACHRDPRRWQLLYETLWRITHGEHDLLDDAVDEQVHALRQMEQAVRRDIHKMHAFVRFEKQEVDGGEEYLAYYRPDFRVFRLAAPFFVERFGSMRWTIFGPDETAAWDGEQLIFLPGVFRESAVSGDELTQLWKSYYASTFNPARLNVRLMRREMPQRFWPLLPEAADVEQLVARAPSRTEQLIHDGGKKSQQPISAKAFLPVERDLKSLAEAARVCQGCSLHASATQTVFGEGPPDARIVFIGEQPGDQEDLAGQPFVGPAGRIFDELLAASGIDRSQAYVTNTVKHFKWEPRGKRRLHAKPNSREIFACRPWFEAELEAIQPLVLVLLGATAAQAVLGPQFRIQRERGEFRRSRWSERTIATYHPSAILRAGEAAHALHIREAMLADFKLAAVQLATT
jgi:DNA polymerase